MARTGSGAFTVTPLRERPLPLEPSMIPAAESQADKPCWRGPVFLRRALAGAGQPFLIRRGERHWLLDAGCGTVLGSGFDR